MIVNVHQAKRQLSKLLDQVLEGEEIVIGRAGRPVARLVPFRRKQAPRVPGRLAGRIVIAEDFDATPEWLLDAFEVGRDSATHAQDQGSGSDHAHVVLP